MHSSLRLSKRQGLLCVDANYLGFTSVSLRCIVHAKFRRVLKTAIFWLSLRHAHKHEPLAELACALNMFYLWFGIS